MMIIRELMMIIMTIVTIRMTTMIIMIIMITMMIIMILMMRTTMTMTTMMGMMLMMTRTMLDERLMSPRVFTIQGQHHVMKFKSELLSLMMTMMMT